MKRLIVFSLGLFLTVFFLSLTSLHAQYTFPMASPWMPSQFYNAQSSYPFRLPFAASFQFAAPRMTPANIGYYNPMNRSSFSFPSYTMPSFSYSMSPQFNPLLRSVFPYPYYGSSSLNSLSLLPDPQWRVGQEAARTGMPPQTTSIPVTGIDTGELRIMPPANQEVGVTYSPVIPGYVNRQLIVMFRPEVPPQERARVLSMHDCTELGTSPYGGFTVVALPTFLTVLNAAKTFITEPAVLYAEPNYYRHSQLIPNDPYYRYQWHLPHMFVDFAWNLASGLNAKVGLLDSGVSYRTAAPYGLAPDLAGTLIAPGWDFVNADAFPDDDNGHGTHMCGCIAQTTNNLLGVAGVAYKSTVLAVKIMDSLGNVTIANEADGIYYAANNGAKIINMSLGGPGTSITEQTALATAYGQGVILFASSGNANSNVLEYPASYPECLSVGAVQYDRTRAPYSNYGTALDLVAPGGNINLDQNLDGYADGILQQTHDGTNFTTFFYYFMEGTSPACALVSGVAALVISKSTVILTPLQITNILETTTLDLGAVGWDEYFGWGEVNAYQALLITT